MGQMQKIETMFEVLENCRLKLFSSIKREIGGYLWGEYQFFGGFIQTVLIDFLLK